MLLMETLHDGFKRKVDHPLAPERLTLFLPTDRLARKAAQAIVRLGGFRFVRYKQYGMRRFLWFWIGCDYKLEVQWASDPNIPNHFQQRREAVEILSSIAAAYKGELITDDTPRPLRVSPLAGFLTQFDGRISPFRSKHEP